MNNAPRLVIFTLDNYLKTSVGITDEDWQHLDAIFYALHRVCEKGSPVNQALDDLLAFCKADQETKELMARTTLVHNLQMDNYILMVLDNEKEYIDETINPEDIIAFILGHTEKELLHITQCVTHVDHKTGNYDTRMILYLCESVPSIERVTVSVSTKPAMMQFFLNLGFTPTKNPYTTLFRNLVATSPESVATHPLLAPIRNDNNTIDLVRYTTRCRVCKKAAPSNRRCGRCFTVSYCCVECQRHDWASHQYMCLPITANK